MSHAFLTPRRVGHPNRCTWLFSLVVLLFLASTEAVDAQTPSFTLRRVSTVGVLDGDSQQVFGTIADVAADRRGSVYVLDSQARQVAVFTRGGRFIQHVGRPGRGPGEFFMPAALAIDSADRLYVLDPGNQRIEVFQIGEREIRRTRSLRLEWGGEDICTRGDRLYVLAASDRGLLHEFTSSGRILRSFASPLGGSDRILRTSLSAGYLECSAVEEAITFLPALSPVVLRYGANGSRSTASLPGYDPVIIERSRSGGITFAAGRRGVHDVASSLARLTPAHVILQVGPLRKGAAHMHDFTGTKSYLLTTPTGTLRPIRSELPRLVAARDGYVFGVQHDPFPRVSIFRVVIGQERSR